MHSIKVEACILCLRCRTKCKLISQTVSTVQHTCLFAVGVTLTHKLEGLHTANANALLACNAPKCCYRKTMTLQIPFQLGCFLVTYLLLLQACAAQQQGVFRLLGPLVSCQVSIGSSTSTTDNQGDISYANSNAAQQVLLDGSYNGSSQAGSSCIDSLSNVTELFPLTAVIPANGVGSNSLTISTASLYAYAVLDYANVTNAGQAQLEAALQQAYLLAGVALTPISLPAVSYKPMLAMQNSNATARYMGIAAAIAETQLTILVTLGHAMLSQLNSQSSQTNNSTQLSNSWTTQAIAYSLVKLTAAQGLAVAPTLVDRRLTPVGLTLTSESLVLQVLQDAVNNTLGSQVTSSETVTLTAVATAIANLASHLDPYKLAGQEAAALLSTGLVSTPAELAVTRLAGMLNPLDVLFTCAQMTKLLQSAAQTVVDVTAGLTSVNVLSNAYASDAVATQLLQSGVNKTVIHAALGLPAPPPAQPAQVMAQIIGPLSACPGISEDYWTASKISVATNMTGQFSVLPGRSSGQVSLWPQGACSDVFTNLTLQSPLTTVSAPLPALLISPISLLTDAYRMLLGVLQSTSVDVELQQLALSTVGLQTFGNSVAAQQYVESMTANSSNGISTNWTNQPSSLAIAAANAQVMAWVFLSRALFTQSVYQSGVAGSSLKDADLLVVRLAAAAVAYEASSSVINTSASVSASTLQPQAIRLDDTLTLQRMISRLQASCFVNSTTAASPTGRRKLQVYTDSSDFQSLAYGLADILAGINSRLYTIQSSAMQAVSAQSSITNISSSWISTAQLAALVQGLFYNASLNIMSSSGLSGSDRAVLLLNLQANMTRDALTQTLAVTSQIPLSTICAATGSCNTIAAQQSSSKTNQVGLGLGLGFGLGLGLPFLVFIAWSIHRCFQDSAVLHTMTPYHEGLAMKGAGNLMHPSAVQLQQAHMKTANMHMPADFNGVGHLNWSVPAHGHNQLPTTNSFPLHPETPGQQKIHSQLQTPISGYTGHPSFPPVNAHRNAVSSPLLQSFNPNVTANMSSRSTTALPAVSMYPLHATSPRSLNATSRQGQVGTHAAAGLANASLLASIRSPGKPSHSMQQPDWTTSGMPSPRHVYGNPAYDTAAWVNVQNSGTGDSPVQGLAATMSRQSGRESLMHSQHLNKGRSVDMLSTPTTSCLQQTNRSLYHSNNVTSASRHVDGPSSPQGTSSAALPFQLPASRF